MRYEITHITWFRYEAPVSRCLNEVHLTPRQLPSQQVIQWAIQVEPTPVFLRQRKDYFGNDAMTFAVIDVHYELKATAKSIVEVVADPPDSDLVTWEEARARIAAPVDAACREAAEFIYPSPYVPPLPALADFARESFKAGRPLLGAARELSHRIYKEFKYAPKTTRIEMPLSDVVRNRRGVCQDFAHIMIGALRSLRLPARYVSGYVRSGAKVQGAQASHAWVSVFVPGHGWISFDPTNDVMPSDAHVTLAWGRDYGDVTPIKGVTLGGGGQTVEVEVYMKAIA